MIVREINSISCYFDSIDVVHIFREANLVAHAMAHLNPLEFSTRVWVGSCPSEVENIVATDFCLNVNEN